MELIDKYEVYRKAMDILKGNASLKGYAILNEIYKSPIIETDPTKHGRWLKSGFASRGRCSICDKASKKTPYCPNCGAKMDGDGKTSKNDIAKKDNFICHQSVIWCDGRKNGACKKCRLAKCSKCLNGWSYFKEYCKDCIWKGDVENEID